ncbi:hypothetical protein SK224_13590 [Microbacterium sp. BG28]|uniref:hypothetical protein n=1 Tax=Microbacterium sp. BG28 TaxID=3097356 RepID=UPI002A5A567B|nr:hypothetical protein [Microbacterium sp. BG28]MDY0830161.1 hypothetical protein [Microbacterium sp. BG28]
MTTVVDPTHLTPSLQAALRRAVAAERDASGSQRRVAFRNTRVLLGALQAGGFDLHHMAEVIGVTVENVRARAQRGGVLSAASAAHLTGLDGAELAELVSRRSADATLGTAYSADDVVAVLRERDAGA